MTAQAEERAVLEEVASNLEAEGFQVFLQPSAEILPAFLRQYSPDAIAISATSSSRNFVIEVAQEGAEATRKAEALRNALKGHQEWDFRLYLVSPHKSSPSLQIVSYAEISQGIETVERLLAEAQVEPALLMAWATFEALCRAVMPDKFAKPQTPGRLVEVMGSLGLLTPSEADRVRSLIGRRNAIAHGGLTTKVDASDVRPFVEILKQLLSQSALARA